MVTSEGIIARLERLPASRWHVRARFVVGAATLFDAIDSLSIASILPVLTATWNLSPTRGGLLISAGYMGQLLGAILFGWMAERHGRLRTLTWTVAIYSVFSLLCALSWDYTSLLILRTLQGVGLGGEVPVAAVYINELAKAKGRGRFFLMYEQAYSAGRVVAALLGVSIVTSLGWRYMFLLGGIPALLVLAMRRMLPESPRWLASTGRWAEADAAAQRIETQIQAEGKTIPPVGVLGIPQEQGATDWRELFRGIYRTRTLVTWTLWFVAFLILNGFGTWVATLYSTTFQLPVQTALRYNLWSTFGGFCGCVAVALLIDWTGCRRWMTAGYLCAGLACISLWFWNAPSALTILVLTTVVAFFINSVSMVLFLNTTEIYPTRLRALGTSSASAWLRIASIVGPAFVGFSIGRFSLAFVFFQFGLVACAAAVVAALFTVETRGRVLEEISP